MFKVSDTNVEDPDVPVVVNLIIFCLLDKPDVEEPEIPIAVNDLIKPAFTPKEPEIPVAVKDLIKVAFVPKEPEIDVICGSVKVSTFVDVPFNEPVNPNDEIVEPVTLSEPDSDISYASTPIKASIDCDTCQDSIVFPNPMPVFDNVLAICVLL
jgi:hypothetical protein